VTRAEDLVGPDVIGEILALSPPAVAKLLERGDIPSVLDTTGTRVASRADVMEWRTQRELRRTSLTDLSQFAQRTEGVKARQPPGVAGDLNDNDPDEMDV
jgi:hypothetical protein